MTPAGRCPWPPANGGDRPYLPTYARFGRVHEARDDADLEVMQSVILIAVQP